MPEPEEDDISVESLIAREAARVLYGSRFLVEPQPLNQSTDEAVSYMEPSGEGLRRQQEQIADYEDMMLRGMQAFRAVDPARRSAQSIPFLLIEDVPEQDEWRAEGIRAPQEFRQRGSAATSIPFSVQRSTRSLQHWEVRLGQSGYCQIDGSSALTFPLVFFQHDRDRVLIKFTVRFDQLREANRWSFSLEGGDFIFGEILEWRQQQDGIDFTLRLHLEGIEARAQPDEAVQYTFDVDTTHYRRGDADAYRLRLEQAGLMPDRVEALREWMEYRSQPDEARLEECDQPSEQSTIGALMRFHHQLERTGLMPNSAEAIEELRQQRWQPPVKQPTLCNGCRILHGQYHGGTLLVCAMHPYGNGEDCSDFEAK